MTNKPGKTGLQITGSSDSTVSDSTFVMGGDYNDSDRFTLDLAMAATQPAELAERLYGRIVPEGFAFKTLDLADKIGDPRRKTGSVTVTDVDSFVAYIRDQDETPRLYANIDAGEIIAVFDDHRGDRAGRRQFTARYELTDSPEFGELMAAKNKFAGASRFAEFVEDLQHVIASPSTADLLELVRKFRATTVVSIAEAHDDKSGDRTFRYETKTEISEELIAPDEFVFAVPVYRGQEPVAVDAKFRYRASDSEVRFGIKITGLSQIREQAFDEIVTEIAREVPDAGHIIRGWTV